MPSRSASMVLAGVLALAVLWGGCGTELETVNLPEGTRLTVRLDNTISTQSNEAGDRFVATVIEPVIVDGKAVIPVGSTVRGSVTALDKPGNVEGRARLTLGFNEVTGPHGTTHSLTADPITIESESGTRDDIEKIAAGAVAGAIIGGLAEGGKGAAIGAAVGAGAGGVVVVATKGEHLTLESGQAVMITLSSSTEMPVLASQQSKRS